MPPRRRASSIGRRSSEGWRRGCRSFDFLPEEFSEELPSTRTSRTGRRYALTSPIASSRLRRMVCATVLRLRGEIRGTVSRDVCVGMAVLFRIRGVPSRRRRARGGDRRNKSLRRRAARGQQSHTATDARDCTSAMQRGMTNVENGNLKTSLRRPGNSGKEPARRRRYETFYGMVIQVVQRLRLECVPSGLMAETEMRCLPDSKSMGGPVLVMP